ncbi:MAG TPA: deoxyribodipyrimidine photolyase [Pirellulaceae bacterium]|nr:deoxyribodipyrimidine photolyase [Pirellulaceae bacterium]HMO91680.1 deoxyribodipyrimidine photolyase [Pirellulaceae bacterium]HMP68377.1 deoxyribodipyrimidine photolyase [Pirellulaceae bacterium]
MSNVPQSRIRSLNHLPANRDGNFVLYWMIANRRIEYNFSLQRAVEWSIHLSKPLVILEALRCDYRWNSDRIHWFVIQGMHDNHRQAAQNNVIYYPYLEMGLGEGKGLLERLSGRACVVVSDDFPCFFIPKMTATASRKVPVCIEVIDSNGVYPMRSTDRVFQRAYDFRRHLQKSIRPHLQEMPIKNPAHALRAIASHSLQSILPPGTLEQWPVANLTELIETGPSCLKQFPIDHSVPVSTKLQGGRVRALQCLKEFIEQRLAQYADDRNHPDLNVASGLSPYLHFGHISAHEIFLESTKSENWSIEQLASKVTGSSSGWWGASKNLESFLDELTTWRELGFNQCALVENYDHYESLPAWAIATLDEHAGDAREFVYTLEQFELAQTHDPLWNAAQNQLRVEGIMQNYLRMLWGKKILHWTESPQIALSYLIELNNKYALDGRNPNSYSGIFWCLGKYDRPWGPERGIFGKIRYMSSDNTRRKLHLDRYLQQYGTVE